MEDGHNRVKYEARNASGLTTTSTMELINVHERKLFLSGQKLVAVISEAASAGISLHADRYSFWSASASCSAPWPSQPDISTSHLSWLKLIR